MPKFVFERQYLVPMYQHIVVEAEPSKRPANWPSATIFPGMTRRWIATTPGQRRSPPSR